MKYVAVLLLLWIAAVLLTGLIMWAQTAHAYLRTPTATPTVEETPIPLPTGLGGGAAETTFVATEPSIATDGTYAVVLGNTVAGALYDVSQHLATYLGRIPLGPAIGAGDPFALWSPLGPHLGSTAKYGYSGVQDISWIADWRALDAQGPYTQSLFGEQDSAGTYTDRPMMAQELNGRLWAVWTAVDYVNGIHALVSTSIDNGVNWTPGYDIQRRLPPRYAWIAAIAPDRLLVVWPGYRFTSRVCRPIVTPTINSIRCTRRHSLATWHSLASAQVLPNLRAGTVAGVAAHESSGDALFVWSDWSLTATAQVSWIYKAPPWYRARWSIPAPIAPSPHHQIQPALVAVPDGSYLVTWYEQEDDPNMFHVVAAHGTPTPDGTFVWQVIGRVGRTINAGAVMNGFLGDYSSISCAPSQCVAAWTGTLASDPTVPEVQVISLPIGALP